MNFSDPVLKSEYDCFEGGEALAKSIKENDFPVKQDRLIWFGFDFWLGFITTCEQEGIVVTKEIIEYFPFAITTWDHKALDERLQKILNK